MDTFISIVLIFLGLFLGLFLWSNVLGSLFATIPAEKRRVKEGSQQKVHWLRILFTITLSLTILLVASYFSGAFMIGAGISLIIMIFNIGNLQKEERQARG